VPREGPKLEGAALFSFTHKLVLQAASVFFEGNSVTKKRKGGGGEGGEGAGNPKKIEFINFLYKKSKFYLNNNNLFIYGKEGQEQSYFKEGKRSKSLNLDHSFYDVIKNIVGFKKILSGSMTCSQIWLS
jgi:hypothetical protein